MELFPLLKEVKSRAGKGRKYWRVEFTFTEVYTQNVCFVSKNFAEMSDIY